MPIPTFAAGATPTAAQLNTALSAGFPVGIDAWTGFTPTLVQSATVTKTVSYASYMKVGRAVWVGYSLAITGTGTAANVIQLGLPFASAAPAFTGVGSGMVFDSSASTFWTGTAIIDTASTVKFAPHNAGNYLGAGGFVAALAVNDIVSAFICYQSTT